MNKSSKQLGIAINFKHFYICIALLLIPIVITFQPFFPKPVQWVLLYSRLIVLPFVIMYVLKGEFNFFLLFLLLAYIFFLGLINYPSDLNDFFIIFFSLISSISFFKLGHFLSNNNSDKSAFIYFAHGTTIVNILTIAIYYLIGIGVIDMELFFAKIDRGVAGGLFRFSIGNPIEIPFTLSCMLYSAIVLVGEKKSFLISTSLNLLTALLSQSRVVVLIALLLFVGQLRKSSLQSKFLFGFACFFLFPYLYEELELIYDSLFNRLSGNDYGSKEERTLFLNIVIENLDALSILFGKGLTSGSMLLQRAYKSYRTVESVFIQFLYELGFVGSILFVASLFVKNKSFLVPTNLNLIIILIIAQLLVFLPIFTLMPITFFLLGVCSKPLLRLE